MLPKPIVVLLSHENPPRIRRVAAGHYTLKVSCARERHDENSARPASSEMHLQTETEARGALELPATMNRNFRPLREEGRRRPMLNSFGKITTIDLG